MGEIQGESTEHQWTPAVVGSQEWPTYPVGLGGGRRTVRVTGQKWPSLSERTGVVVSVMGAQGERVREREGRAGIDGALPAI